MTWVERQLKEKGFRVLEAERLPILYSEQTIRRQLNVARSKLPRFKDASLAEAMGAAIDALDAKAARVVNAQPGKRITHEFDYVIAAEIDPEAGARGGVAAGAAGDLPPNPRGQVDVDPSGNAL